MQNTLDISEPIARAPFRRNYNASVLIRVSNSPDNPIAHSAKEVMRRLEMQYLQNFGVQPVLE